MQRTHVNATRPRTVAAVLVASAALIAGLLFAPGASAATVRWVDAAAASSTPGSGCGGDAGYTTIQAAIVASVAGDTIEVCPGTYTGPITINRANLTIRGAKAGIPAGPSAALPAGRGTGESIIEAASGNVVNWSGSANINTTIDGLTIRNLGGVGAGTGFSTGTSGHKLLNNIVEYTGDPATAGAQQSGFIQGAFNGFTIRGNHVTGFRYGLNFQSGNLADAPSLVEGNYIGKYVVTGVVLGNNTANGHKIRGNTISPDPSLSVGPAGISGPTMAIEISGNTFAGAGSGTAIFFLASARSGIVIEGNTISNWGTGIGHPNVSTAWPVGSTPTEVHLNNITGNSGRAINNPTPAGDFNVNATCNWWGSALGWWNIPFANSLSIGTVNATPWLTSPAPGGDCVGGLSLPVAEFTLNPTEGEAPLPVDFDASTSSVQAPRTIASYSWNFGDGNTASGVTAAHTYTTPGQYTVTLTVTDSVGLTSESSNTVTVVAPKAAPTAAAVATPSTGPAPLAVTLDASGSSDSDGTIVSYSWDLGDGGSASGAVVNHTYSTPGTYVATVTVTDNHGLTDTAQVAINVSPKNNPLTDNDCKKNGWAAYGFRNQGQCVRFVQTGKDDRIGQ